MPVKIGSYTLYPIETGRFALDGGAMFGVVPKTLWSRSQPADEKNRITLAARCLLLIHDDGRKILIDNGIGHKYDEKFASIYRVDHAHSSIVSSLGQLDLAPGDITDIILTHLHFDHAGGSTQRLSDGRVTPTFPNARYYVQRRHLDHARRPVEKDRASFLVDDYEPVFQSGAGVLLDGPDCPLPDIRFFIANGHSPYQQLPIISDGQTTVFFCGDLIPTSTHVNIPYVMAYDNQPLVTIAEKKEILGKAFDENWILFLEHDPGMTAVTVRRDEKGYHFGDTVDL